MKVDYQHVVIPIDDTYDISSMLKWCDDNKIAVLNKLSAYKVYQKNELYALFLFGNLEDATLFKLTWG